MADLTQIRADLEPYRDRFPDGCLKITTAFGTVWHLCDDALANAIQKYHINELIYHGSTRWWFRDETGAGRQGPFDTYEQAKAALERYVKELG